MKTAIVYYSKHHGNTRKLLDAIALKHEVTLIHVTTDPSADLSGYDRVGIAKGHPDSDDLARAVAFYEEV